MRIEIIRLGLFLIDHLLHGSLFLFQLIFLRFQVALFIFQIVLFLCNLFFNQDVAVEHLFIVLIQLLHIIRLIEHAAPVGGVAQDLDITGIALFIQVTETLLHCKILCILLRLRYVIVLLRLYDLLFGIADLILHQTYTGDDLYQLGIQLLYFFLQSVLLTFQTADLALALLILTLGALLLALFLLPFLLNFFPCLCLHTDRLYSDRCHKHNCCYFFPVMISHPYLPFLHSSTSFSLYTVYNKKRAG